MLEDKLTQDQRIRLESLAQASMTSGPMASSDVILARAKAFEKFIKEDSEE